MESPEEVVPTADLIVNTTSVGLTEDYMLFDYSLIRKGQVVFELLYNRQTLLKEWAEKGSCILRWSEDARISGFGEF